jgi:hypothetical protein
VDRFDIGPMRPEKGGSASSPEAHARARGKLVQRLGAPGQRHQDVADLLAGKNGDGRQVVRGAVSQGLDPDESQIDRSRPELTEGISARPRTRLRIRARKAAHELDVDAGPQQAFEHLARPGRHIGMGRQPRRHGLAFVAPDAE